MTKFLLSLIGILLCATTFGTAYYLNDGTMDGGELWATAIGDDANDGLSKANPKLTFADIVGDYNLAAGDTVYIDVGNYSWNASDAMAPDGNGTYASPIVIIGAGKTNTIITATGTDNALDLNKFDHIIFRDFKLTNSNGGVLVNIQADAGNKCDSIVFRDVELAQTQNSQAVNLPTDAYNIYFRGSTITNAATQPAFNVDGDSLYLDQCTVSSPTTSNGTIAVNTNCGYIVIDSCTVSQTGSGAAAILLNGATTTAKITYNTINATASNSKGFLAYGMTNVDITDNEFVITDAGGDEYGIDFQSGASNVKIERNWIKGGDYGLRMSNSGSGSGTIYNNAFANNKYGIKIDTNTDYDIYYNTFRTSYQCIRDSYLSTSSVKNNIFATTGNSTYHCVEINGTNGPPSGEMDYNAYYYPNGAYAVRYNSTNYDAITGGTVNWNDVLTDNDDNSIDNQDPIFMGPADDNLSLHSTTPLANEGVDLSPTVTDDIWGAARDATPFIGAYETSAGSILPVEWAYFNGSCAGGNILLEWATLSENNNDHFVVEFSDEGTSVEQLDQVWGAGTTSTGEQYRWVEEAEDGLYRLKQVDYDGNSETTEWVNVSCSTGHGFGLLKAKEVFNNLYINSPMEKEIQGSLEVFNIHGQVLINKEGVVIGNGRTAHVPLSGLDSGVYWVVVRSNETSDLITRFVH